MNVQTDRMGNETDASKQVRSWAAKRGIELTPEQYDKLSDCLERRQTSEADGYKGTPSFLDAAHFIVNRLPGIKASETAITN